MSIQLNYKKILIVLGKITFLLFAFISMAFVNNELKNKTSDNIVVKISSSNVSSILSEEDVLEFISQNEIKIINQKYTLLNFNAIENKVKRMNEIKSCHAYVKPNGDFIFEITERKPIARIYTNTINCYIDDEYKLIPAKFKYSFNVPLFIGHIYEDARLFRDFPINRIFISDTLSKVSVMDNLYQVVSSLLKDTLINKMTDYFYILPNQEIIMHPVVGKFEILIGTTENFQQKMNKLKLFIENGLNKNNTWNQYTQINLKYQNLVYCTKK